MYCKFVIAEIPLIFPSRRHYVKKIKQYDIVFVVLIIYFFHDVYMTTRHARVHVVDLLNGNEGLM